jgi:hypothetical protein
MNNENIKMPPKQTLTNSNIKDKDKVVIKMCKKTWNLKTKTLATKYMSVFSRGQWRFFTIQKKKKKEDEDTLIISPLKKKWQMNYIYKKKTILPLNLPFWRDLKKDNLIILLL